MRRSAGNSFTGGHKAGRKGNFPDATWEWRDGKGDEPGEGWDWAEVDDDDEDDDDEDEEGLMEEEEEEDDEDGEGGVWT